MVSSLEKPRGPRLEGQPRGTAQARSAKRTALRASGPGSGCSVPGCGPRERLPAEGRRVASRSGCEEMALDIRDPDTDRSVGCASPSVFDRRTAEEILGHGDNVG